MRPGARRGPSAFTVGAVVLVVLGVATWFGFTKRVPFRHHHTVKAVFRSANDIRAGSPVRIAGVNVGKVTGVERLRGGAPAAVVRMEIDDRGLPLHRDARAAIRPRIFLEGNFFVDLQPGSPSAPRLGDGGTIPAGQTSTPVQLDQVLSSLQADTRRQLQVLLDQLSRGISGAGADGYRRSTRYWVGAYRDGAIVADAQQGEHPHDLSRYIDHAGAVAGALDRDPRALQDLVSSFNATARAFADNEAALGDAVGELPATLRTGRTALGTLNAAFPATRRLVRDLRPAVRSSGPALQAGLPFVSELRGLVRPSELQGLVADLRPAVPALAQLDERSQPLYEQVRAASSCQNEVILPWTKDRIDDKAFPTDRRVFEEATKPLSGLAGESRAGDANGQWFRVLAGAPVFAYPLGTDRLYLTATPLQGVNPTKPAQRSPLRPDVPCETQQAPDLRSNPGPAPEGHRISVPAGLQGDYQKLVDKAAGALQRDIEHAGLSDRLKVSTTPVTADALDTIAKLLRGGRR